MATDALAAIRQGIADLQTAVTTETATLQNVLTALKNLGSQPTVNPADVTALAAQIESSVATLNTANSNAEAVLNPPAPAPAPSPAPAA